MNSNLANLLLLEDDAVLAFELKVMLELNGFDVTICKNAKEAMVYCQERAFRVAVVDIFVIDKHDFVPDGGLTFLSRLRNNRSTPLMTRSDIPVIAMSGGVSVSHQTSPLQMAMTLGAVGALAKPVAHSDLLAMIRKFLPGS